MRHSREYSSSKNSRDRLFSWQGAAAAQVAVSVLFFGCHPVRFRIGSWMVLLADDTTGGGFRPAGNPIEELDLPGLPYGKQLIL